MRKRFSSDVAPVDVFGLAKVLGCRISSRRISVTGTVQADLSPDACRDLFYLRVDPEPAGGWGDTTAASREETARHRLRFRIGHELGHTFFYERRKGRGPRRAQRWSSGEEEWCDEFARLLLVPTAAAKALPPTAGSVFRIQRRFDVSLEVAARAVAAAHREATVVVWFWPVGSNDPQGSLLRQWTSHEVPALRHWRQSALVDEALVNGGSEGELASGPNKRPVATARCGRRRRQIVVVAG